jgi:putative endopeptidase
MRYRFLFGSALIAVIAPAMGADATSGIGITAMNTSISAGDDFYGYANGNWFKRTQIPADQSRWGDSAYSTSKSRTGHVR